jgi:glycosyltransferase involved in cell wall biosynthesis|tara:strand:+ start:3111 stop:4037 length:927 start_codon:yes stop_codon:yes gene_type:complete
MKKVSVIIPAYNNADYTVRTIKSVINQTYKNIEIIVVDDGSTDDTSLKLKQFKKEIIYIYQSNQGASIARNNGMKIASGDYIAHLDCDDLYEINKIEVSIMFLEKNDDFGFIYTDVNLIDKDDKILNKINKYSNHPGSGFIGKKILKSHYVITNSTIVARKSCFDKVGGFDKNIFLSADREMLIRLSTKFKASYINKSLTRYRIFNNRTYQNIDKSLEEFIYIIKKYSKNNFLSSRRDQKISYSNIYYYYFKLYTSLGYIENAKTMLKKIFRNTIFFNKIHLLTIAIFFLYFHPNFLVKYFKKYNLND